MASNRDLFGDDDSDIDDDENNIGDVVMIDAINTTTGTTTTGTDVVVATLAPTDETLQNEEEDIHKEKPSNLSMSMDTSMDKKEDVDDDDDDDDDAPQFNDQDVVGTKSSTNRIIETTQDSHNNNNNNDEELSTTHNNKASAPTAPKVIPIRPTLVVPDTFRTFPSDLQDVDHTVKYFTKLPNFMGIQTMGFSHDTYTPALEEEVYQQAAYNLIRWRYKIDPITKQPIRIRPSKKNHESKDDDDDMDDDGELSLVRESNTKLVEWEDGSHTLHIGSECFHVDFVDSSSIQTTTNPTTSTSTSFPGLNGYLYLSQNATYQTIPTDINGDGDDTPAASMITATTTKKETILQSMGSIQQRMILRPSSLQSEAHKSLTVGIRQKTIKKARIAEVVTQEDPELIKQQKMKLSYDLEKTNLRKRNSAGYGTNRVGSGGGYTGNSRPRMSKGYLEDDEDYDTTNLKDMKRRTMNRYEDDDDDDDDDMRDYGDDDDDDDDDDIATLNKGRPSRRGVVGSLANAASTKTAGDSTGSKNAKSGQSKKDDDDDDDDVFGDDDDDDDEDDIQLKTKSQKKKLHQAVIDDDDDDE